METCCWACDGKKGPLFAGVGSPVSEGVTRSTEGRVRNLATSPALYKHCNYKTIVYRGSCSAAARTKKTYDSWLFALNRSWPTSLICHELWSSPIPRFIWFSLLLWDIHLMFMTCSFSSQESSSCFEETGAFDSLEHYQVLFFSKKNLHCHQFVNFQIL